MADDFDPDAFLAGPAGGGGDFDPDAFLASSGPKPASHGLLPESWRPNPRSTGDVYKAISPYLPGPLQAPAAGVAAAVASAPETFDVANDALKGMWDAPGKIIGTTPLTPEQEELKEITRKKALELGQSETAAANTADTAAQRARRGEGMQSALFGLPSAVLSPAQGAYRHFVSKPIEEAGGFPHETTEGLTMAALAPLGMKPLKTHMETPKAPAAPPAPAAPEPLTNSGRTLRDFGYPEDLVRSMTDKQRVEEANALRQQFPEGPPEGMRAPEPPTVERPGLKVGDRTIRMLPPDYAPEATPGRASLSAAATPGEGPLAGISKEALDLAREDINASHTPHTGAQRLEEMSPHQTLGEFTPTTQDRMGALATHPGNGKDEVVGVIRQRTREVRDRLRSIFDRGFGEAKNTSALEADLQREKNRESSPYWQKFKDTPIPPTATLDVLNKRIQKSDPGVWKYAEQQLEREGVPATAEHYRVDGEKVQYPTAAFYEVVREGFDKELTKLIENNAPQAEVMRLTKLKKNLTDAIDNHPDQNVSGLWKKGREISGAYEQRKSAMNLGQRIMTNNVKDYEVPELTGRLTPEQRGDVLIGIRRWLEDQISTKTGTGLRNIEQVLTDSSRNKITHFLGEEKAEALFRELEHERDMIRASPDIIGNSKTEARRQASKSLEPSPSNLSRVVGVVRRPLHGGIAELLEHAQGKLDARQEAKFKQIREELGRLYTLQGPERDAVIRYLLGGEEEGAPPPGGAPRGPAGPTAPPAPTEPPSAPGGSPATATGQPDRQIASALQEVPELKQRWNALPKADQDVLGEFMGAVRSAAAKRQITVEDGAAFQGDRFNKAPLPETPGEFNDVAANAWLEPDQALQRANALLPKLAEIAKRNPDLAEPLSRAVQAVEEAAGQRGIRPQPMTRSRMGSSEAPMERRTQALMDAIDRRIDQGFEPYRGEPRKPTRQAMSRESGSGVAQSHLDALQSAEADRPAFEAAYTALENDKSLKVSDLKEIAKGFRGGYIAKAGDTRADVLREIKSLFTMHARFLNKVDPARQPLTRSQIESSKAPLDRRTQALMDAIDRKIDERKAGPVRKNEEGNEGLAYLLSGKGKASGIGQEHGNVARNGISDLVAASSGDGYDAHRLVYSENGKIVGAMQITTTPSAPRYQVANAFVAPEFRRKGIATKLNQEAERRFGQLDRSEGPSPAGLAFRKSLEGNVKELSDAWTDRGVRNFIADRPSRNQIQLSDLVVPKDKQGTGIGTEFMNDLTKFADAKGKTITLTAAQKDDNYGTTSQSRLKGFYKRFGFVENKGRNKDFTISDTMYRRPKSTVERASGGRVLASAINKSPSEAQKEAGNYAKDHVSIHGLDIAIENAKGHARSGVSKDGNRWSVKMPAHYGYIKRTLGKDGDHVDVYLGPHTKSPHVWVIDQRNAETKSFDEHKAFIGFASKKQVIQTYRKAFSDGKADQRLGHIHEMSIGSFKHWLEFGDTTKPMSKKGSA